MKKYRFIFSCEASAYGDTEREAREEAALKVCHLTPNDMEYRVLSVSEKTKDHAAKTYTSAVADFYDEKDREEVI